MDDKQVKEAIGTIANEVADTIEHDPQVKKDMVRQMRDEVADEIKQVRKEYRQRGEMIPRAELKETIRLSKELIQQTVVEQSKEIMEVAREEIKGALEEAKDEVKQILEQDSQSATSDAVAMIRGEKKPQTLAERRAGYSPEHIEELKRKGLWREETTIVLPGDDAKATPATEPLNVPPQEEPSSATPKEEKFEKPQNTVKKKGLMSKIGKTVGRMGKSLIRTNPLLRDWMDQYSDLKTRDSRAEKTGNSPSAEDQFEGSGRDKKMIELLKKIEENTRNLTGKGKGQDEDDKNKEKSPIQKIKDFLTNGIMGLMAASPAGRFLLAAGSAIKTGASALWGLGKGAAAGISAAGGIGSAMRGVGDKITNSKVWNYGKSIVNNIDNKLAGSKMISEKYTALKEGIGKSAAATKDKLSSMGKSIVDKLNPTKPSFNPASQWSALSTVPPMSTTVPPVKTPPTANVTPAKRGILSTIGSGVANASKTALAFGGKLLASKGALALGGAAAVGATGYAGYKAGQWINDKFLTNEKGEGIIGKKIAEMTGNAPSEENGKVSLEDVNKARVAAGKTPMTQEQFAQVKSAGSKHKDIPAVVKSAIDKNKELESAKDIKQTTNAMESVTKPIIATKATTINNDTTVSSFRIDPRTQENTFVRYLEGRYAT